MTPGRRAMDVWNPRKPLHLQSIYDRDQSGDRASAASSARGIVDLAAATVETSALASSP